MNKMMLAAIVIFALVILGVGALWLSARGMVSKTTDMIDEAGAFGKKSTDAQCFEEALSRYRACTRAICELMQTPFATNCLRASRKTPDFCEEVPSLATGDGGESWRKQRCLQLGGETTRCHSLLSVAQKHCREL